MLRLIDILGVNISVVDIPKACAYIEDCIASKEKTYVCIAPVSTIVDCQKDTEYRRIINGAGMTTPDGIPLVWLGKLRGERSIERTYGPDLMLRLCEISPGEGYKHYFYGGRPEVCDQLETRLKKRFPGLSIVGHFSPPFSPECRCEEEVLEKINQANPDILWVGLGSPKQDFWMAQHRQKLTVPVMIGVGAAFDFLAKTKKQAPRWMQQAGLEWFFRLCCEPRRLWKRYLLGNSQFLFFLMKDYLKDLLYR